MINPVTGAIEKIKRDDPTFYNASGFKARRYKGSSKPMDIPPFLWKEMSTKERRKAIAEEQKKIARMSAEPKAEARAAVVKVSTHSKTTAAVDEAPSMPVLKKSDNMHRPKIHAGNKVSRHIVSNSLVANLEQEGN